MDLVLLTLLSLPVVAAGVIVAVSSVRRGRRARRHGTTEPVHRAQSAAAAVQDAAVYPTVSGRRVESGRARRAGAAHRVADR